MVIFISLLLPMRFMAQIVLDHAVVSPFALQVQGNGMLTSTVGQVETSTLQGTNQFITQGFEQPNGYSLLFAEFEISLNLCTNLYDVKITSISSCQANDTVSYFWNGIEGTAEATGLPPQTTIHISSIYGCVYHGFFNFEEMEAIEIPCDLNFYNFISPNDDGDNDKWKILNITADKYTSNQVIIYNRWGAEVWKGDNYDNQMVVWHGNSQDGSPLPDGTYFYVVKSNAQEFNGYIELQR